MIARDQDRAQKLPYNRQMGTLFLIIALIIVTTLACMFVRDHKILCWKEWILVHQHHASVHLTLQNVEERKYAALTLLLKN